MDNTHADRLLQAARSLRASLVVVITQVDSLCELVEKSVPRTHVPPAIVAGPPGRQLRIERTTYTVRWGDRRCRLGNTTAFALIEQLARRPNEYISVDRLLDDLWTGARTYSTVRSTVYRLKRKLHESAMQDLADLIDGRTYGHYALLLAQV
ncbi:MAG: winged helix-turn-helix domain-containing protein [Phycisphaerales bacterium]|nr:winged helix-turn-helix domain-containing protein [Phycisphaerales bacterium]